MYAEYRSALVPATVWTISRSVPGSVLPDGCMDLIWCGDRLLVAGPDTEPHVGEVVAADVVGLRFHPGVGPHVLGIPAVALRNSRVLLADLWGEAAVRALTDRLLTSRDVAGDLEALARQRLRRAEPLPRDLGALVAMLARGTRVGEVAAQVGLSERQLHRRSLAAFGYGPKVLSRILRFVRAGGLLHDGMSAADAAAMAGYADQPHMSREFRALAGAPAAAHPRAALSVG
jgi:AraC-like DNA-binding protein